MAPWLHIGAGMLQVTALAAALLGPLSEPPAPPPTPANAATATTPTDDPTATRATASAPEMPARRGFNYKRAGWEIGAAMGIGVIWYQSQIELNKLDFDFDRTWAEQWRRLSTGAGYRFDDNNLTLNVGHAFMGTYYHQFARNNGGSMLEAILFDFVTSSTWELLVEHREVVSLNDTVVTTFGGVALGESLYQAGEYFARSKPTLRNRVLMGLFSPARAFSWLTGDAPESSPAGFHANGLAADAESDISLAVGGRQAIAMGDKAGWQPEARGDFELLNLPEYGRAGSARRTLSGGEFTRIEAAYVRGKDKLQHAAVGARASMWGRYHQTTHPSAGGVTGSATFFGSASAFEVAAHDLGSTSDFVAAVHVLGPTVDTTLFRDAWRFRLAADLYPDFAMVRSYAIGDAEARPHPGMKTTLQDSYYYALGVTGTARLEAGYRRLRAGLAFGLHHFDSIEGLDRHQNAYTSPTGVHHPAITDDSDIIDDRLKMRVFSEAPLPLTKAKLGVSLDYQRRSGTTAGFTRVGHDVRWGVHARYAM